MLFTIALFFGEYACSNVYVMIGINFLLGITVTGLQSIGYVYMMEFVKLEVQPKLCTAWSFCDGSVFLIITIYFTQINKHWEYITLIGFFQVVWATFVAFLTPESPKFLLNQNRLAEGEQTLQFISTKNGKEFKLDMDIFK